VPIDPEPARLRNPDQLRRAASWPLRIIMGSILDADRGATLKAVWHWGSDTAWETAPPTR